MSDQAMNQNAEYVLVFSHSYEWVNRGEWRSGTHEGEAIDAGRSAAMQVGKWDEVYASTKIVVQRTPCDKNHIDLCWHGLVEFYREAQNDSSGADR